MENEQKPLQQTLHRRAVTGAETQARGPPSPLSGRVPSPRPELSSGVLHGQLEDTRSKSMSQGKRQ